MIIYHPESYGIVVIPRPVKIVRDLMNVSLREENTAPLLIKSFVMWGSETTTKS